MRRIGIFVRNCAWRQLITLVCLSAFVFVATVHAGQHFGPPAGKAAFSTLPAPSDGADDRESTDADTVCLVCVLAAAELATEHVTRRARFSARVETSALRLETRPIPTEFPPPIA